MLHEWRQRVTPGSLTLWFLSTAAPAPLRTVRLIDRAAIFDIEPGAVRVSLGRLVRQNLAIQPERGVYALGPAAAALHAKARGWMDVEEGVRPWSGTWMVVLTHHLGRTNRQRLQARERALRLTGFLESRTGIWVRPDNLRRAAAAVQGELVGLGLEPGAVVFAGCSAQPDEDAAFRRSWTTADLEAGYRYWIGELAASTIRITDLPTVDAARETFLLGQSVLRAINSDPLLPAELVDAGLRARMVASMKVYNANALRLWEKVDAAAGARS